MELIITLVIVGFAAVVLYKSVNKSSKGGCNCGSCSSNCPSYKDKSNKK